MVKILISRLFEQNRINWYNDWTFWSWSWLLFQSGAKEEYFEIPGERRLEKVAGCFNSRLFGPMFQPRIFWPQVSTPDFFYSFQKRFVLENKTLHNSNPVLSPDSLNPSVCPGFFKNEFNLLTIFPIFIHYELRDHSYIT